ncbi:MlaA family lipoprotein [Neisseria animalis]|uniref:VacJ family lipoprotein n=1 Tax=Neisseria animalis TaxID=492 RepID=A0A5P3MQI7_NEIAN|nr:VacJ family lipoprotein [Neisseria animalis]QEY23846.1 VacJ family lipoprotein [Neisseria animalis]ROW32086.1 VacJ family lipoprotein [Neisseria animalis]VEE05688.1 putative VacJ-like protein [Neisseria animalis]
MKKTVPILLAALLAAQPALAERNPADPYEPYNRAVSKFNDKADQYIMSPVARGYRKITPKPVRTGISNFFNNLRDVTSFGSNLLRLDIKRASEDLVRVGINTTFGLGGLIDVAGAGGVPDNKNTLGDTFASWGWKNSNYFVVPLLGPSTVRDTTGNAITTVYPVKNAVLKTDALRWGTTGLNAVSTRENLLDLTDSLDEAALDKYSYTRDLYMRVRSQQTGGVLPQTPDEDLDIDDLVDSESHTANPTETDTLHNNTADTLQTLEDNTSRLQNDTETLSAPVAAESEAQ